MLGKFSGMPDLPEQTGSFAHHASRRSSVDSHKSTHGRHENKLVEYFSPRSRFYETNHPAEQYFLLRYISVVLSMIDRSENGAQSRHDSSLEKMFCLANHDVGFPSTKLPSGDPRSPGIHSLDESERQAVAAARMYSDARFLAEFVQKCCFSLTTIMGAFYYISRLRESGHIRFHEASWRSLFIVACLLSEKMWEDNFVHPHHIMNQFAALCANSISVWPMNILVSNGYAPAVLQAHSRQSAQAMATPSSLSISSSNAMALIAAGWSHPRATFLTLQLSVVNALKWETNVPCEMYERLVSSILMTPVAPVVLQGVNTSNQQGLIPRPLPALPKMILPSLTFLSNAGLKRTNTMGSVSTSTSYYSRGAVSRDASLASSGSTAPNQIPQDRRFAMYKAPQSGQQATGRSLAQSGLPQANSFEARQTTCAAVPEAESTGASGLKKASQIGQSITTFLSGAFKN